MAGLSISQAWDETKAVLRSDGKLIAAVALALLVLPGVVSDLFSPTVAQGEMPEPGIWLLVALAAMLCLLVGILAISRLAVGPRLSVGEAIGHAVRRFIPLIGASLLWALPFLVVFALLLGPYVGDPQSIPAGASLAFLLLFAVYLFIGIRMILLTPVAANEAHGPVTIIKRSWDLTSGHWWKLFATLMLFVVLFLIVVTAVGAVFGSLVVLVFGQPEPFSVSALLIGLLSQIASAVLVTLLSVMLARIYSQLAGQREAQVSVPDVS